MPAAAFAKPLSASIVALVLAAGAAPANAQDSPTLPPGCADANGHPRATLVLTNSSPHIVRVYISGTSAPIGASRVETLTPGARETYRYALHVGSNYISYEIVQGESRRAQALLAPITILVANRGAATCSVVRTAAIDDDTPKTGATILVESAQYGLNCPHSNTDPRYPGRKDVTSFVAQACNGKSVCTYPVNHRVIGDPAYGCPKDLRIEYQCAGGLKKRAIVAPEASGRYAHLAC